MRPFINLQAWSFFTLIVIDHATEVEKVKKQISNNIFGVYDIVLSTNSPP